MSTKKDNPSAAEKAQHEDTDFATSSQLTTVLGDYSDATPSKVRIGSSSLIIIILLIIALLGAGAYMGVQQVKVFKMQDDFQSFFNDLDQTSASAAATIHGDAASWNKFKTSINALNASWDTLSVAHKLDISVSGFTSLKATLAEFSSMEARVTEVAGIMKNAVDTESNISIDRTSAKVWMDLLKGVENRVSKVNNQALTLKTSLTTEKNKLIGEINDLQKLFMIAALVIALLITILIFTTLKKIKTYEGVAATERNQLKGLVDDWQKESEEQRLSAQERYASAQRVNEANQAAILRLMNELQNLAEGDLTQQATVTEDITGAIADSVNYTMEELRNLVSQVQGATELVSKTTATVETTSTELLASSDEQLREIHETGQAVLDVANRITNVSVQAQESASVARQSMDAAEKGLLAVQNAIGGMNTIRDQIQDTSKRIKRLVESSQEIGEITDLIADITEQTNVLALNAAIQAASAGEAGRGFSIVAEEVQRLAERSAAATRQIASLIKTIQGDMHGTMEAMERSTRDVVEGAKQTDNTGTAFTEIDAVTRKLASLIQQISDESQNEARVASGVAQSIQHIFAVTEQTADGTRSTALQVRELARVAEQLERSVARFRIS